MGGREGAPNGIWREEGCVSGRREHKMGFGGRPLDVRVGGGSAKWDFVGGRMCEWEEGAQNRIWREGGCAGGRLKHIMGGGGSMGVGMGEGKRVSEHRRQNVSLGGLELDMSRWKLHQNQTEKFWENQPSGNPSVTTAFGFFRW